MDSQIQIVSDNSDGITLLGGGGGMAGKSSTSVRPSSGRASVERARRMRQGRASESSSRARAARRSGRFTP